MTELKVSFTNKIPKKSQKVIIDTLEFLSEKLSPVFSSITVSRIKFTALSKYSSQGEVEYGEELYDKVLGLYFWEPHVYLWRRILENEQVLRFITAHEFMHFVDRTSNPLLRILYTKQVRELLDQPIEARQELEAEIVLGWDN